MKITMTYECEFCGRKSADESAIRDCENQGFNPSKKLKKGEKVYCNFTGHPEFDEDFVGAVVIDGPWPDTRSHTPIYKIQLEGPSSELPEPYRSYNIRVTKISEAHLFYGPRGSFSPVNPEATAAAIKEVRRVIKYTQETIRPAGK